MVAVPSIGRATQVTPRRGAPEADATRDLYERYARQIHAFCLHQLGSREEAEDAVQSTFLNAFRGLKRGIDPEFESAWLYKIAENVCLTRQRSSYRRRRVESPGDLDAMQDLLPAREADADELIRLPEALEEMPEQQRRALLLREWQGLSYREIAGQLGLSQSAVETLLFRARRSLANALTDDSKPKSGGLQKLRTGGDAGSLVALVKTLVFSGGAKVAATVVTVAATSAVASSPAVRHSAEVMIFAPAPTPHAKPVALARHVQASLLFHTSPLVSLAATRPRPLSGKLIAAASRAAYTARLAHARGSVHGLAALRPDTTAGLTVVSHSSVVAPPSPARRAADDPVVVAPPAPAPPVVATPTPVATDTAAIPATPPAGDAGSGTVAPVAPTPAPTPLRGPQSTTPVVVATPLTVVPDAKAAKAAGKDARKAAKADDKAASGHGKKGDAPVATTPALPAPTDPPPTLPPAAVTLTPAPAAAPAALPTATPAAPVVAAPVATPPVTNPPPVTQPDAGNGDKNDHGVRNGHRK